MANPWRIASDYLMEALVSPEAERRAWTLDVAKMSRAHRGGTADRWEGSGNYAWMAALSWATRTGDFSAVVRLSEAQLSGRKATGWQNHEVFDAYQMGVSAARAIAIHVARREGRKVPKIVEDTLRIDQLLLGLLSVHTRGKNYRYNSRVIAPALREKHGPHGDELAMLDRDYQALAFRRLREKRPPAPLWGKHHRIGRRGAQLSNWWLGAEDSRLVGVYISGPTIEGAEALVDRINGIAESHGGIVRLRPTRGAFRSAWNLDTEATIVQERRGDDALAYLTAWSGHSVTRPPWAGMAYLGHRTTVLHPYPIGWGVGPGGSAGLLRAVRKGSQLVVAYHGAKRMRIWPTHSRKIEITHTRGAWRVVLDPRGLVVEPLG